MANIVNHSNDDLRIVGTSQADSIDTGSGKDKIFARGGLDVVFAGGGNDAVFGQGGNDALFGAGGKDKFFGGTGSDLASGGGGNDRLAVEVGYANFGTDVLEGGNGFDTIVFETAFVTEVNGSPSQVNVAPASHGVQVNLINVFAPGAVKDFDLTQIDADGELIVNLAAPRGVILNSASLGSGALGANGVLDVLDHPSGVFADVEEFDLTGFADYFLDLTASHIIDGGNGDDFISGGGGADTIEGGAGRDTALYRFSSSRVSVTLIDLGSGGSGSGGEAQGDRLFSIENVFGSEFNDVIIGDGDANILRGFGGPDSLLGGNGADRLVGGDGNDKLTGGAGRDGLEGGLGNDTLDGGADNDQLNGGAGSDTALFQSWNSGTLSGFVHGSIVLSEGKIAGSAVLSRTFIGSQTTTEIEHDSVLLVENVVASNFNDSITGNDAANTLEGRGGSDVIDGGSGPDTLLGGAGNDRLIGGPGSDTASYLSSPGAVTVSLLALTAAGGDAAGDTFASIENLTGSEFADTLIGDANANVLSGAGGRDVLIGGGGPDTIDGGGSVDKADYAGSPLGVTVDLSLAAGVAQTSAGDASGDKLFNIEDVSGSGLGDVLKGNDGANRLSGRGGDDRLEGGSNSDNYIAGAGLGADRILDSGGGADVLSVASFAQIVSSTRLGDDLRIVYSDGGSLVIEKHFIEANRIETALDLATNTSVVLAAGNIGGSGSGIISGTLADDFLDGRGGNDRLFGNAGLDVLVGGRGNDRLAGGDGNDTLTGGPGKNVFLFNTVLDAASNVDTITDFSTRDDTIGLDDAIFASLHKTGKLNEKFFHAGASAGDKNDFILYDKKTGALSYDADGNREAFDPIQFATLDDARLSGRDFLVV